MTSLDDVISLKFSEIHGQYFPLSNFKKKDTLVFSSLSSIRLGLSPKGSVKRKRPSVLCFCYVFELCVMFLSRQVDIHRGSIIITKHLLWVYSI